MWGSVSLRYIRYPPVASATAPVATPQRMVLRESRDHDIDGCGTLLLGVFPDSGCPHRWQRSMPRSLGEPQEGQEMWRDDIPLCPLSSDILRYHIEHTSSHSSTHTTLDEDKY